MTDGGVVNMLSYGILRSVEYWCVAIECAAVVS